MDFNVLQTPWPLHSYSDPVQEVIDDGRHANIFELNFFFEYLDIEGVDKRILQTHQSIRILQFDDYKFQRWNIPNTSGQNFPIMFDRNLYVGKELY